MPFQPFAGAQPNDFLTGKLPWVKESSLGEKEGNDMVKTILFLIDICESMNVFWLVEKPQIFKSLDSAAFLPAFRKESYVNSGF